MAKGGWTGIALTTSLLAAGVVPAGAAENGTGFYLLGSRGPMAAGGPRRARSPDPVPATPAASTSSATPAG